MLTVLFLCTGNSCRSVMAEGVLNHLGGDRFQATSAGSFPTGSVHPLALRTLEAHGMRGSGYRSKSWDEFAGWPVDVVLTVCDDAAGESCPVFPGTPVKAHWGVPDPAHAAGSAEEVLAVFENVYAQLERRVRALLALPVESMSREDLAAALRTIGSGSDL